MIPIVLYTPTKRINKGASANLVINVIHITQVLSWFNKTKQSWNKMIEHIHFILYLSGISKGLSVFLFSALAIRYYAGHACANKSHFYQIH